MPPRPVNGWMFGSTALMVPLSTLSATRDVAIDIEGSPVPGRILEHDVLVVIDGQRGRLRPAHDRAPAKLGAGRVAGKHLLTARRLRRAHERSRGLNLPGRQAFPAVRPFRHASDLRIEMAARRIADEAVLDAIQRVARVEHGAVDHRVLFARDERRRLA